MRVVVYPADRFACGHYRTVWPAQAVERQEGFEVGVVPPGSDTGVIAKVVDGEVVDAFAPECDLLVVQRPARRILAHSIAHLRRKGIAVVVDIDDDLEKIHKDNPAYGGMDPRTSPDYNHVNVRKACADATMVTVSTPALAEKYGPPGRVRLLRNCIPARFLDLPHDAANGTLGWAGSLHSHPNDLTVAAGAMRRLHLEGHDLMFVGPREGMEEKLQVELPHGAFTGNLPFGKWVPAVAERIGVGVAPLSNTPFNRAKSWLKPLEYMAAGVPWVGSVTPEYQRIAAMCGAPTASKSDQWFKYLREYLSSENLRWEASQAGRAAAAELTFEKNAHLWAEVWHEAVSMERATEKV